MSTPVRPPPDIEVDGWHWVGVGESTEVRLWDAYSCVWQPPAQGAPHLYLGRALSPVEVRALQIERDLAREAVRWRPIAEAPDRGAVLHLYIPGHQYGPAFQMISTVEMYPSATYWMPRRPAP